MRKGFESKLFIWEHREPTRGRRKVHREGRHPLIEGLLRSQAHNGYHVWKPVKHMPQYHPAKGYLCTNSQESWVQGYPSPAIWSLMCVRKQISIILGNVLRQREIQILAAPRLQEPRETASPEDAGGRWHSAAQETRGHWCPVPGSHTHSGKQQSTAMMDQHLLALLAIFPDPS